MSRRTIPLPFAVDLRRSLHPLRLGKHDPTIDLRLGAVALSMRTPDGPATLRAAQEGLEDLFLALTSDTQRDAPADAGTPEGVSA